MPRKHTVYDSTVGLVIDIPFTPEEERARDKEEAAAITAHEAELERQELKASRRAAAITKLGTLGLTSDEIEALLGN